MSDRKTKEKSAKSKQDLRQEVAALASQLGLAASTGEEAGFDDTDFRPPAQARKPKAAEDVRPQREPREVKPKPHKPTQAVPGRPSQGPQHRAAAAAEAQKKEPARVWNTGVGPRPGRVQFSRPRRSDR